MRRLTAPQFHPTAHERFCTASLILAPGVTAASSPDQILAPSSRTKIFLVNGDSAAELPADGGTVYVQLKRSTGDYSTIATIDGRRPVYDMSGPAVWRLQHLVCGRAIGAECEVGAV